MTEERRNELKARARDFVKFKSIALHIAGESVPYRLYPLADEIMKALLKVEREVWVSVMNHIRSAHSGPDLTSTGALMELYDWCRQQKEAL